MAKNYEMPEVAVEQELNVTKEEAVYANDKERKDAKAKKYGYALYRKYKIFYAYLCKPFGVIFTFIFVSAVLTPIKDTEFAIKFAADFSERIGAAAGAGPTSGILINMIAIPITILFFVLTRTSKMLKYAKELEKKSKS